MEESQKNENLQSEDDEISLIDLISVLFRYKVSIIVIVVLAMIFSVIFSIVSLKMPPKKSFLPNVYKASANMLINEENSSAKISSSLSGLANLAGLSVGGAVSASYTNLAIYLITSNPFLDAAIQKFKLMENPALEKSKFPLSDCRDMLKKKYSAETDKDSGVFTISFKDIDPVFSRDAVDFAVDWLSEQFDSLGVDKNKVKKANLEKNIDASFSEIQKLQNRLNRVASSVSFAGIDGSVPSIALETTKLEMELSAQQEVYKNLKVQYELLKVDMASETPVFQILERAEIPEKKDSPSRGMLCIITTFAAAFIAIFLAFSRNAIENIKNDPVAMKKLKSSGKK